MLNTYRALFRQRSFAALWTGTGLLNLAVASSGLALGLLVHQETDSAFLSAAVMFGPSIAQALGGLLSMSAVDSYRPRLILCATSLGISALLIIQFLPISVAFRIAAAFTAGYLLSLSMGARYGVLSGIVDQSSYSLGRSAINIVTGLTQIIGYAAGSLVVATQGIPALILAAAVCALMSVAVLLLLPSLPAPRTGEAGVRATFAGNRQILAVPGTRPLILALTLPNGLIVGCEALFVAFIPESGGPGVLYAAAAIGMLGGDVLIGRVLGASARQKAADVLRFALAVPFLFFMLDPPFIVCFFLVVASAVGYGASLAQQEVLNFLTPRHLVGQAFGFESAMRMAGQGMFSLAAGALADLTSPGVAMALLAITSLLTSLILTSSLRRAGSSLSISRRP